MIMRPLVLAYDCDAEENDVCGEHLESGSARQDCSKCPTRTAARISNLVLALARAQMRLTVDAARWHV